MSKSLIKDLVRQQGQIKSKIDSIQHPVEGEDIRRLELLQMQFDSIDSQLHSLGFPQSMPSMVIEINLEIKRENLFNQIYAERSKKLVDEGKIKFIQSEIDEIKRKIDEKDFSSSEFDKANHIDSKNESIASISFTAAAFAERTKNGIVQPPKVATIYRIASEAVNMAAPKGGLFALQHQSIDRMIFGIACLIQNDRDEPTEALMNHINTTFTAKDIQFIASAALGGSQLKDAFEYFQLNQQKSTNKFLESKADSIIHRHIGSYMKYFNTTEQDVKWNTTWENYLLFLNSIPSQEEIEKPKAKTVDANDFFGGNRPGVQMADALDVF